MTIQEMLKDKPDVLKEVEKAMKDTGAKFVDLKDGGYVDAKKYSDLETKHNEMKTSHEAKIKELEDGHKTALQAERDKLSGTVKDLAIDAEISRLGINNKLTEMGIRNLINKDDIQLDENFKITGGLDTQLSSIKETYKDSFVEPTVISTGQSVKTSQQTGTQLKKYTLAEIQNMKPEEAMADIDNILSQIETIE